MGTNFYRDVDLVEENVLPADTQKNSCFGKLNYYDGISYRSPTTLLNFTSNIRSVALQNYYCARSKLEYYTMHYYYNKIEKPLTYTFKSIHSDHTESLNPAIWYITLAGISGSILTKNMKNKGLLFNRLTTPLIFSAIAFSYTLPTTFNNSIHLINEYQHEHYPRLASVSDSVGETLVGIGNFTKSFVEKFD